MEALSDALISSDSHIIEPPDLWEKWLPKDMRPFAPKLVKDTEGGDAWLYNDGGQAGPLGLVTVTRGRDGLLLEPSARSRSAGSMPGSTHRSMSFCARSTSSRAALSSARERLLLYLTMSADYAREHAEWARLLYLEIWPSVFVSETELQYTINDFAKIVQFLVEIGKVEGWVDPTRNKYDTAAIIIGGSNQLIITWLLYRKPRNLTKAGAEIGERIIRLLECERRAT